MARRLGWLVLRVTLAIAIALAAAVGLAALRGGDFGEQLTPALWIVGCLMLGMALFSLSPSTRHAPGEVSNAVIGRRFRGPDDRGGAGMTLVLALAAAAIFGIAALMP